jgi:hypothetical protein
LFLFGGFLKISSPLKPHGQMNRNLVGSFKGEDILEIDQSETRTACGGHVC